MSYLYPQLSSGGDCGACSTSSRPCTPTKKFTNVRTLTLDFSNDPTLVNRYIVNTGTLNDNQFVTSIVPTGPSGIVLGGNYLVGNTSKLLSASYSDATHPLRTEGGLFSVGFSPTAVGVPSGYAAVEILIPTGVFGLQQRQSNTNGVTPTGTFNIYYFY